MRRYFRSALLALLAFLLPACSAPASPAPTPATPADAPVAVATPGGPVTITFGVSEFEWARYEPLVERFMAEQPAITVQLVPLPEATSGPDGTFDGLAYQRQVAEAADSAFGWRADAQVAVRRGLFLDLQPLLDADPSFAPDDYLPGALSVEGGAGTERTARSAIASLPSMLSVPLYAYDRERFSERGVAEPTADLSFAQLLERAQQVAQTSDSTSARYGIYSSTIGRDVLLLRLREAGIDLGPSSGTPPPLSDARYADALAAVQSLTTDNTILYESPARRSTMLNDNRSYQLIDQRRVAIWPAQEFGWGQEVPAYVGFLPMRDPLSDQPQFFSPQGYSISAGTQHPEAAWRWLSFLSRQYVPMDIGNYGWIPPRRSLLDQHWQGVSAAEQTTLRALVDGLQPWQLPTQNPARFATLTALDDALDRVLDRREAIPQALAAAETLAQEELAKIADPIPTAAPDPRPVVVATPVPALGTAAGVQQVRFGVQPLLAGAARAAAERFNGEQSELAVTVEVIDGGGASSLAALSAQFDCFASWAGGPGLGTLDLQPLIDADPSFDAGDFPPVLLEQLRKGSQLTGLPLTMDVPLLIYNRELFAAAGVTPPQAGWTLDDLSAAAEQLTSGPGAERRYGLGGVDAGLLFFVLERSGIGPVGPGGQGLSGRLGDPQVAAAIQRFVALVERTAPSQRLSGYTRTPGDPLMTEAIQSGRVALWLGSTNNLPFAEGSALPTALAPVPLADGRLPGVSVMEALYISAINQQPEGCWRWMQALSASGELGDERSLPARLSLLDGAAARPNARPGTAELVVAYRAALSAPAGDTAAQSGQPFNSYWLLRAVDRTLQGGDLDNELAEAQFVTEQYVACVRGGEAAATCARQVDPTYDGW